MNYFHISKKQLLFDLYVAYEDAARHKKSKPNVVQFSKNLHSNLESICEDLWNRTYIPRPSTCFIVDHPKKREIFAADFRDRVVHHLYFNYVHQMFENTFIHDTYSCIQKRGTHFGIKRLKYHIIQESDNYKTECYALKMDIKGYFTNINRQLLCDIASDAILKMSARPISKQNRMKWAEVVDIDLVLYITKTVALLEPTKDCIFRCDKSRWIGLANSKSLFHTPEGCGLPIGNLTSQLFSNIFLNILDQYVKRILKFKHYGRYVDDFYIICQDKRRLHKAISLIENFLKQTLDLDINKGKTKIIDVKYGVEFLGAYIKPRRCYVLNSSLQRIKHEIYISKYQSTCCINSFLGILSHYKSFNIRVRLSNIIHPKEPGIYNDTYTKFKPYSEFKLDG